MRIKVSFLKVHGGSGTVPLHHQKIISSLMDEIIREIPSATPFYNFSSLKGTSKVQNGQIRFLSSKVSLVISAAQDDFAKEWVERLFEKRLVSFAKLTLVPKSYEIIPDPEFKTEMKYVCISPMVPSPPFETDVEGNIPDSMDPRSQEFSDAFYNTIMDQMESAGYSPSQLQDFAEFEIMPDPSYIDKILNTHKKFARIYKNNDSLPIFGYLLPFKLHAHPAVQKFVWDCGIGLYTNQGYGMVDIVGGVAPVESTESVNPEE